MCVCVAVTHQASWEAAAKLMDAKERQREEGEEGGRERWLSQVGDKCLYCSNAGARERDVNELEKKEKKKRSVDGKQCGTQMPDGAAGMVRDDVCEAKTSLCNLIFILPEFLYGVTVLLMYPPPAAVMTISSSALPSRDNKPRQGKHSLLSLPSLLPPLPSEQTALPPEATWQGEGHSGLSTSSLSALSFHPVVNKALLGQPAADVFTSQQRK